MRRLGMTEVIEIGPGKVLSGFLRKIDKSIPTSSVEDEASLSVLLEK
jgi:[acyl-carrier-protein] S-malonyltransferase